MTLEKITPKKSFAQTADFSGTVFLLKLFWVHFYDGFFDTAFALFEENSFHLLEGTMDTY